MDYGVTAPGEAAPVRRVRNMLSQKVLLGVGAVLLSSACMASVYMGSTVEQAVSFVKVSSMANMTLPGTEKMGLSSTSKYFATNKGDIRVSIYGDSITAGCCCESSQGGMSGYPDLLKKYFASQSVNGAQYQLHVLASAGRTATIGGNPKCYTKMSHGFDGGDKHFSVWGPKAIRGASEVGAQIDKFKKQASEEAPDVVLIMLGTNDAYTNWAVCEESFVRDMTALIRIHQNLPSKPRIVLINPPIFYQGGNEVQEGSTTPYLDSNCAQAGIDSGLPETEAKCIVKRVIPHLLRRISTHCGIDRPMDLAHVLDETSMVNKPKGGYDIHPTCAGHQAISEAIKAHVFPPVEAVQDQLRVASKNQLGGGYQVQAEVDR